MERTRGIDERLKKLDDEVKKKRPNGEKANCRNIINNIRYLLRNTSKDTDTSQTVIAEIVDTARCDEHFGNTMQTVRSRLVEHLEGEPYRKCIRPIKPLNDEEALQVDDALAHYRFFIDSSAKKCMSWPYWIKAQTEDFGAFAFLVTTGWTVWYRRRHGARSIFNRVKTSVQRKQDNSTPQGKQ